MSPLRTAILAQLCGVFVAYGVIQIAYPVLWTHPYGAALACGGCAALISHRLEAPRWWIPIHGLFPLAGVGLSALAIPPAFWLLGFVTLLLIFWRTDQSRVPLYLSNAATADALLGLIPATPCQFLDLGCGTGGFLRRLALARPDCRFVGIEHAPLPWLWAWLRCRHIPNIHVRYGDLWQESLAPYSVVYAFLSPAPMSRLWQKAAEEMNHPNLLISNSFKIGAVTPTKIIAVHDRRQTHLYCYRVGA